jgi:hypothetical protein
LRRFAAKRIPIPHGLVNRIFVSFSQALTHAYRSKHGCTRRIERPFD